MYSFMKLGSEQKLIVEKTKEVGLALRPIRTLLGANQFKPN